MKKTLLLIATSLLFIGCSQPKNKVSTNWDPSRDVNPTQNGKKHGLVKNYDGNGNLLRTTNYFNGLINGIDTWYDRRTFKISLITPYLNGKKNGLQKQYQYNSRQKLAPLSGYTKTNFVNGQIHGFEKSYFADGKLQEEIPYKNGKKHGVKKLYSNNGKLSHSTTYKNGKKNGPQRKYNIDGSLRETIFWSNDVRGKISYSAATKRLIAQNKRDEVKFNREYERKRKKGMYAMPTSSKSTSQKGRTRITQNDGKFIAGVCSDESTFFIEKKNYLYEGSGTNGVCSKSNLQGTISCVCSGG